MSVQFNDSFAEANDGKRQIDEMLHLPDLQFFKYCKETFGVNRGVYNTIEQWFFNKGINQIVARRNIILAFFQFMKSQNGAVKFGAKGLTESLNDFFQRQHTPEKMSNQAKSSKEDGHRNETT